MSVLWIILTVLVATVGGWPVTAGILRFAASRTVQAAERLDRADSATDPAADSTSDLVDTADPATVGPVAATSTTPANHAATGVLRGGLVIGLLERAAVVVAVLTNEPVAIAYVVAIKGLGRYPELKDTPAASERFIIGTLASLLWAAVIAALAKVLLL
ncbi:hypothetical protein AL755_07195 [Arthrobacter sp. ERGS1:01]|uniref:hypothetical protein n=1 Tax=Arthrobacter sp. ERGS1:01 TaxID=1704044 RepID=UPI0006B52FDD|nr:hypothetical protein [Arthrobacter sp. ERGS1:01]ALE05305.1 hypothetical protein AL755_07195 [Arthrobacter sp. ERGS1:01]